MQNEVSLYEAAYKEHGLEEILKRLQRRFKLSDLGKVKGISFVDNCIIINNETKLTIVLEDETYQIRKHYSNYETINSYLKDNTCFNKIVKFYPRDGEILALESIKGDTFEEISISKTSGDDQELSEPYFERGTLRLIDLPISEKFRNTEYSNDDSDQTRLIDLNDNFYYYHVYNIEEENRFLETAACLDEPRIELADNPNDPRTLLYYAQRTPNPNIQFRGCTVDGHKSVDCYYDVVINKIKEQGLFTIQIDVVNQLDGSSRHYSHLLPNQSIGEITEGDLKNLAYFLYRLDYKFSHDILNELMNIKDRILEREGKKLPDYDFIELELRMYPDFNKLAFLIYEHLESFSDSIKDLTHRDLSENRKKSLN